MFSDKCRSGDDTITLPAGNYHLLINGRHEDASATGEVDLDGVDYLFRLFGSA